MAKKALAKKAPKKVATYVDLEGHAAQGHEIVPSAYVNQAEVLTAGPIDVRLAFNEILVDHHVAPKMVRRANLVMSQTTFLNLVQLLTTVAARMRNNASAATPKALLPTDLAVKASTARD